MESSARDMYSLSRPWKQEKRRHRRERKFEKQISDRPSPVRLSIAFGRRIENETIENSDYREIVTRYSSWFEEKGKKSGF